MTTPLAGIEPIRRESLAIEQALLRVWIGRIIAAGNRDVSFREHVPIVEAVERGDPAAAQAAMGTHMRSAALRLDRAIAGGVWDAVGVRGRPGGSSPHT